MRIRVFLLSLGVVLAGCGREAGQGGSAGSDEREGASGNDRIYERGGGPDSSIPSSQQPGSGRVDQGGGKTGDGPIDNSVPTTNSPQSGPSGYK